MKKRSKSRNGQHPLFERKLTLSQRLADEIATFFGSWSFIVVLLIFMAIWITLNVMLVIYKWDPYPFILLNFVLSCLAAIQAPIILMSQNRQAERDRITAKYDYEVNKKAEREIQDMQRDLDEIKELIRKVTRKLKS